MNKFEDDELVYDKLVQRETREVGLLFQRFNYFLVGSAFLVTAFAALVVGHCQILAGVIDTAGFYLSIFFASNNYLATRVIRRIDTYVCELETGKVKKEDKKATFTKMKDFDKDTWVEDFKNSYWYLIRHLLCSLLYISTSPSQATEEYGFFHTYLIPLGFSILWFILLVLLTFLMHSIPWYLFPTLLFSPLFIAYVVQSSTKAVISHKKKCN
jgi:hypothetical protein